MMKSLRQDAEDLVDTGSDRDRDRQDVVDDERGPRDDSEAGAKQLRRDEISASSSGEQLDHLAVSQRNDENRARRHERQRHGQIAVLSEGLERRLRAIGGGG